MTQADSEFINQLLLDFFEILRNSFVIIFILLIGWIIVSRIIINVLRSIFGETFVTFFFFFGGIMHSYWHIFAAKLLGYNVRHTFTIVWQRDDISSMGIALSDGRTPGKIRNAFLIGYAPIMNFLLIIVLAFFRLMIRDTLIESVPPINWVWTFIFVNLLFVGLPDITDLILPIESLFVNYPFFAFEVIWGFFFGVFLYSIMDALLVTFLLSIYFLAAIYAESGSTFLTRQEKRILEPWEILLSKSES